MLKYRSWKRLFLIYTLPLIVLICLLSFFEKSERPDLFLLDRAFQWCDEKEPTTELALVAVSQDDFERGAPPWPWPRSLMARLIDQVSSYGPAVVAVDILYTEESKSEALITREQFPEIQDRLFFSLSGEQRVEQDRGGTRVIRPSTIITNGLELANKQDQELADAVRRAVDSGVDVVLAVQAITERRYIGIRDIGKGLIGIDTLYPGLAEAVDDSLGLSGISQDGDGVLRRYIPYGQDNDERHIYALALKAVAYYKNTKLPERPLPNGDVLLGDGTLIDLNDGQFLVNFRGGPGTYPIFTSRQILRA